MDHQFVSSVRSSVRRVKPKQSSTNKFLDDTMEDQTIKVAFLCVDHKVLNSFRCDVGEEPKLYIAGVSMQDCKSSCSNALVCRLNCQQSLFLSGWLLVEHVSVEAFRIGIAVFLVSKVLRWKE